MRPPVALADMLAAQNRPMEAPLIGYPGAALTGTSIRDSFDASMNVLVTET